MHGSVMEVTGTIVLMLLFVHVSSEDHLFKPSPVTIHCGKDPRKDKVNITYAGDASAMYTIKNGVPQKCRGEHVGLAGLVIHDVNHRKECGFMHLHETNTWTVKVRVQHTDNILTALDSEENLTCSYDAFKHVSAIKVRK
ncbi:uncharacterized protein LOC124270244 [Haliotis rubra]|uniref:uncharacterized protein LOC124270244 n=1 Tax=Haliotis rubra TaxID=36100 RepID=UPI001EE5EE2B|nr:uncharacterized protein LOC124270244 [Haliotis rubra]